MPAIPSRPRRDRLRTALEGVYATYHHPQYIAPDPLVPVRAFAAPADQEVVGLIAASLAFGNVKQILRSIDTVLAVFPDPARDLAALPPARIADRLAGFRHRYVDGDDMAGLLIGVQRVLADYGSLEACFRAGLQPGHASVLPALTAFAAALRGSSPKNYLLPDPALGSACKRWCMYLRWMVRRDAIDPGPWTGIPPELLVVPLDTHMHRVSLGLGLTRRKQPGLAAALEITEAFRAICPEDPVRYDFSLTRLGIHPQGDMAAFLAQWKGRRHP